MINFYQYMFHSLDIKELDKREALSSFVLELNQESNQSQSFSAPANLFTHAS